MQARLCVGEGFAAAPADPMLSLWLTRRRGCDLVCVAQSGRQEGQPTGTPRFGPAHSIDKEPRTEQDSSDHTASTDPRTAAEP